MAPVIASKQSSATFADKEQIWADNASSSPFFGNVYVCFASFTGNGAAPMRVSRSTDGGDTWSTKQVARRTTSHRAISASPAARSVRTATAAPTCSGRSSRRAPCHDRNALHGEVDRRRGELDAAAGDLARSPTVLLRRSCHRPVRRGRSRRSAERPRGGAERGHRQRCSDGRRCDELHAHGVGRWARRPNNEHVLVQLVDER